jgi:hypothetical protein
MRRVVLQDPGPTMGSGVIVVLGCDDGPVIHVTGWIP